jgi:CheY-like chemotaxis protein
VVTLPGADGQPMGFATVSQDMTERRQLEDNLRSLAADLSEADRRKNEFLAILAHELRNPLAPISNAARVLRHGGPADGIKSAAEVLERQVAQMSRLIDDLLDMSRISRGKIELRKQRVELRPIVEQAVESVRPLAESNRQELTVTLPSGVIVLDADPARLAQVIGNLLNNACKFTNHGGQVRLTVAEEDGAAVIRVTDNGIGIAAENLPRLFEMFAQVDTSLERSRDGLGIGLTLVKTLVELHGGTVAVQSAGLGRGTEFIVRLPVAADRLASPLPVAPAAKAPRRRRILIVDDSQDGAESLAMLLRIGGHETHVVHDGAEALVAAERIRPDVILLDIGLPKLNGYEVCSRIRERPWGREVRLVALTGWGQEQDRHRSKAAGFDVHLVKPVDHDVLLKMMAE